MYLIDNIIIIIIVRLVQNIYLVSGGFLCYDVLNRQTHLKCRKSASGCCDVDFMFPLYTQNCTNLIIWE